MLYRVTLGRDEYLGTPEEVLGFLARAQGSPAPDPAGYMRAVAQQLAARMGLSGVPTDDAEAFLTALAERKVLRMEPVREPSTERHDPRTVLGDGPVVYGEGVNPDDVP